LIVHTQRERHATCVVQSNSAGRCWGQIDIRSSNPRTPIIDSDGHASRVADTNLRTERQFPMGRRHCRAVEPLSISCPMTTQAITSAIDCRNLRLCGIADD